MNPQYKGLSTYSTPRHTRTVQRARGESMAMRDERRHEAETRCRALAAGVPARAIAAFGRSVASLSCVSLVFILDVIIIEYVTESDMFSTSRTSESVLSVKKHIYLPFHRQPNPLPPLLTSEGHYEVKEKAEITPSSRPTKSQVVKSVTALVRTTFLLEQPTAINALFIERWWSGPL